MRNGVAPRFALAFFPILFPLLVIAGGGCSSTNDAPADFPDPDVTGRDVNPDGVPYPTDHIGKNERAGTRPGDRIPNFSFQGYPNGDRTAGLQTISLADYFDPDQKRYKLLHLQGAATWCSICASECEATASVKDAMANEGVVYLEVIVNGPASGRGPSLDDVDGWMTRNKSNLPTAIDVRARRMTTVGVDGTVMPWDILIDTRTMEILDSSGGAPADVVHYDRDGLKWIAAHPPSY